MKQIFRSARTVLSDRVVPSRNDFLCILLLETSPLSGDLGVHGRSRCSDSLARQSGAYSRRGFRCARGVGIQFTFCIAQKVTKMLVAQKTR